MRGGGDFPAGGEGEGSDSGHGDGREVSRSPAGFDNTAGTGDRNITQERLDGERRGYEVMSNLNLRSGWLRAGLLLLSLGLILRIFLPATHALPENGLHFVAGFLVGLGGSLIVGSSLRKNKRPPEQA